MEGVLPADSAQKAGVTAGNTLVDLGRTTSQISLVKRELLLLSGLDIQVSTIYSGRTTELLSKPAWQEVPLCRGLILSESQLGFGVSISNRKMQSGVYYMMPFWKTRKCRVCVHMCVCETKGEPCVCVCVCE